MSMSKRIVEVAGMGRVEMKARICHTDDCCPTIYETERQTYLVQGYVLPGGDAQRALGVPPEESIVEIPRELLLTLMTAEGSPAT